MNRKINFKDFLHMSLGCILLSFGVYFFKIPNGFATGGVTGIATIAAGVYISRQAKRI